MEFDFQAWIHEGERRNETVNYQEHPDYKKLPKPLQLIYTAKEHAWLPESVRDKVIESECYPEWEED